VQDKVGYPRMNMARYTQHMPMPDRRAPNDPQICIYHADGLRFPDACSTFIELDAIFAKYMDGEKFPNVV
jgi:hypothetical protein